MLIDFRTPLLFVVLFFETRTILNSRVAKMSTSCFFQKKIEDIQAPLVTVYLCCCVLFMEKSTQILTHTKKNPDMSQDPQDANRCNHCCQKCGTRQDFDMCAWSCPDPQATCVSEYCFVCTPQKKAFGEEEKEEKEDLECQHKCKECGDHIDCQETYFCEFPKAELPALFCYMCTH